MPFDLQPALRGELPDPSDRRAPDPSPFRIAAAQVPSVRGDIPRNLAAHAAAIERAAAHGVAVIVFPELSLTGYAPDLAGALAIDPADARLDGLRRLARAHRLHVVAGAPLRTGTAKPALGAVVIDAAGAVGTYSKMHLGSRERAFFSAGDTPVALHVGGETIGLAICADSSQPSHPGAYADQGAGIYAAGVFLNEQWYATDVPRLAGYAARHRMLVLMANHAASAGTHVSVGRSAVWGPDGALLAQAGGDEDALLIAVRERGRWRAWEA